MSLGGEEGSFGLCLSGEVCMTVRCARWRVQARVGTMPIDKQGRFRRPAFLGDQRVPVRPERGRLGGLV